VDSYPRQPASPSEGLPRRERHVDGYLRGEKADRLARFLMNDRRVSRWALLLGLGYALLCAAIAVWLAWHTW
jgi:hypothetical protein